MKTSNGFVVILATFICGMHGVLGSTCSLFSGGLPEKKFYSPYYPSEYPENAFCQFMLRAPRGFKIEIVFHRFNMKESDQCEKDFIEIYDGDTINHPRLGRYCSSNYPPSVTTSSGSSLYLKFKSQSRSWKYSYEKFAASYLFVPARTGEQLISDETDEEWSRRFFRAAIRGGERLRPSDQSPSRGSLATARAAVALRLAAPDEDTERLARELELSVALALISPDISINKLSLFVNALLSVCQDPRHFYGNDLVDRLLSDVISTPGSVHPWAYLALCNAHQPWPDRAIPDLQRLLNTSEEHPLLIDMQAVAATAVVCMSKSNRTFTADSQPELFADYDGAMEGFKKLRHSNGSFGNAFSTALIAQAVVASGQHMEESWSLTPLVDELAIQADPLATYLALPVFVEKSFADIASIQCSGEKKPQDDIESVASEHDGPTMAVHYRLWAGEGRRVVHSASLTVPSNFSAHHLMRLAASRSPDCRFEWDLVGGKMQVYEMSIITNDPEMGFFWMTYVGSSEDTLQLTSISPELLALEDGQFLVMWYKYAPLPLGES